MNGPDGSKTPAPGNGRTWCQPGDAEKRRFVVRFDDVERGEAVFDDEAEARAFRERADVGYDRRLFGAMPIEIRETVEADVDDAMLDAAWRKLGELDDGEGIYRGHLRQVILAAIGAKPSHRS